MDIRNCIAELLSEHDCVIIPGLGGFIGNYSPARIDPVYHTFQPPYKKLLFNINLKQNDGLLANTVADSAGTSYNDACTLIDQFTEECRLLLKDRTAVVIPGVGQLNSGKEGNIQFEQDKNINLLPDSYGFVSFISPPVTRNSFIMNREQRVVSSGVTHNNRQFVLPRVVKWAAILVLPVGLAAVIGLTRYNKLSFSAANDANILSSVFSKFSSAALVEKKPAPYKPLAVRKTEPAVVPPAPPAEVSFKAICLDDPFAVIVGAFKLEENAGKCIAELKQKGIEATVFDRSRTGLFRVTIGTSSRREKAGELLALAKSGDFRDAWLLAK
ncbi:MAG: SPOR domain-containing protein [Bacteroidota bacterium]